MYFGNSFSNTVILSGVEGPRFALVYPDAYTDLPDAYTDLPDTYTDLPDTYTDPQVF